MTDVIGVNRGMGDASPQFTVGVGYITIPPVRMVNWTAVRPQTQETTRHVCIFYLSNVKYQFYTQFQN